MINDRYLVCTDEDLPLGMTIHLMIPSISKSQIVMNNGRYYRKDRRSKVTRAYLEFNGNFIRVKLTDISERHRVAMYFIKAFYPEVNLIKQYDKYYSKALDIDNVEEFNQKQIETRKKIINTYSKKQARSRNNRDLKLHRQKKADKLKANS